MSDIDKSEGAYVREGEEMAFSLGNRGAVKFNAD